MERHRSGVTGLHGTDGPYRLVYRSIPAVPPGDVILDIIRVSERRNAQAGCAGALAFATGAYVQVIEGPAPAVLDLFRGIEADRRHHVLWARGAPVARRLFDPALPMAFLGLSDLRRGACAPAASGTLAAGPGDAGRAADTLFAAAALKYPAALGLGG